MTTYFITLDHAIKYAMQDANISLSQAAKKLTGMIQDKTVIIGKPSNCPEGAEIILNEHGMYVASYNA